jgi:hypothetical protein
LIDNEDHLLRRIRPDQIVEDKNTGNWRPSSAAFKDPNMSVDVEPMLISVGLDHTFTIKNTPTYSLVRLKAGDARALDGITVEHRPIAGDAQTEANPAHAEVVGKKTPGTANRLRDRSSWAVLNK